VHVGFFTIQSSYYSEQHVTFKNNKNIHMKKSVLLIMVLGALVFSSCKENASSKIKATNVETAKERDAKISLGGAIIEFDKTEYDFGSIVDGEVFNGTFKITNSGKADLILTQVKPSCGCTTPDWPKEPIAPGASGEIKFSFNSAGRVGKQNKSITIRSNAEKPTEIIRIKGTVTAKS